MDKTIPKEKVPLFGEETCEVCGGPSEPRHNQPSLCKPCYLFTWRRLNDGGVFHCKFNGSCVVTQSNRRCRFCRLKKISACWDKYSMEERRWPTNDTVSTVIRHEVMIYQLRKAVSEMESSKSGNLCLPGATEPVGNFEDAAEGVAMRPEADGAARNGEGNKISESLTEDGEEGVEEIGEGGGEAVTLDLDLFQNDSLITITEEFDHLINEETPSLIVWVNEDEMEHESADY